MNFFAQQDRARSKTTWLVVLLVVAVAALIVITCVAVAAFVYVLQSSSDSQIIAHSIQASTNQHFMALLTPQLVGMVAAVVLIVVVTASLYKLLQLNRGGSQVAMHLGGRLINTDTRDANERKILNVVEEMAIASGNPVPSVYLLEETGINAFAAGFDRQDAVIGITRGCIEQLNRDELQGVIAHEFSHIHFGDMRLNMRLIALLHGILVIGLIGYFVLRSAGAARRKNAGAQLALGLTLVVVGYVGTFFGSMIKAAVSRQREFLADASAVQFTRNPSGIADALKRIGGWQQGSQLQQSHASEYSHLYFAKGISQALGSVLATHPPLTERIRNIDPQWDGRFLEPRVVAPEESRQNSTAEQARREQFMHTATLGAAFGTSESQLTETTIDARIGNPTPQHVAYAQALLEELPLTLKQAAHEPFTARAVIYALLLDKRVPTRETQLTHLKNTAHPATFRALQTVYESVRQLPRTQHLPVLELCIPALKQLSKPQYTVFKSNLVALVRADEKVSLFEWSLYRIVTHAVEERRPRHRTHLDKQHKSCQLLLSAVCYAGKSDEPANAFRAGSDILGLPDHLEMIGPGQIDFSALDVALNDLAGTAPLEKPRLLKAIAACIHSDDVVTADEAELFRAVADSLDCPVPPILDSPLAEEQQTSPNRK